MHKLRFKLKDFKVASKAGAGCPQLIDDIKHSPSVHAYLWHKGCSVDVSQEKLEIGLTAATPVGGYI